MNTQPMSVDAAPSISSLALGVDRHQWLRRPPVAIALGFALVALIAAADFLTGYEIRLAILYLVPISLVTWLAGRKWGVVVSATATLCWLLSFQSTHVYSRNIYHYWDGAAMVGTFVIFVLLLARLRRALEHSDERFVRVVEGLSAPVYVTDERSGEVLFANARCVELLRGGTRLAQAADIEAHFSRGRTDAATELRHHESGRWYLAQEAKIRWVDGRRVRLNVLTDVSEQKEAQELKRAQQEALHQNSRLVTLAEIASTLAHELNQPLVAIASYNEACSRLLRTDDFDREELLAAMEKCRAQAVRAGEIMNRLRDFIRRRQPNRARHALTDIVGTAVQLAETDAARSGVRLVLDATAALPPVWVDRVMIEQVVLNLVKNAIEAMQSVATGAREVVVRAAPADAGTVLVSVADCGPGVSQNAVERLFVPFLSTKPGGLGLGLSICRSIVEAHGGQLWYAANPDGGSTFHFMLPAYAHET